MTPNYLANAKTVNY